MRGLDVNGKGRLQAIATYGFGAIAIVFFYIKVQQRTTIILQKYPIRIKSGCMKSAASGFGLSLTMAV